MHSVRGRDVCKFARLEPRGQRANDGGAYYGRRGSQTDKEISNCRGGEQIPKGVLRYPVDWVRDHLGATMRALSFVDRRVFPLR